MARVLIVGCGCRGRGLAAALADEGLAVRGSTRRPDSLPALTAAGVEAAVADPDRLGTLVPHLEGVSAVCWLLGSASGPTAAQLNGPRLETLLEQIVDTPVRGLVYEAAGSLPKERLAEGEGLVRVAGERWQLHARVVWADPGQHSLWRAAMTRAVAEVLR
jgi:nucleoside-diphosphate-sugar epimerase